MSAGSRKARPEGRISAAQLACGSVICLLFGGAAAALPQAWCRTSPECHALGVCFFDYRTGQCKVSSDSDCKAAPGCAEIGACSARGGRCVASTDEGCRLSKACVERGQCAAEDGECVTTDEGCAATRRCAERGYCAAGGRSCVIDGGVAPTP
jgi:hypothetical protein